VNTPDDITRLPANHVFVFGSNEQGFHAGGAAAVAVERFGAVWGQGEGLQGQSYAIPTMEGLESLGAAVGRFIEFAASSQAITFWVTKIGTGIAGHSVEQVAPFFVGAPSNVVLPVEFEEAVAS
jgi:hypothetical protein